MSLITTCPECKTSFIVKPEHLSAHRGNVRCGKCDHVFNALDKLVETAPAQTTIIASDDIIKDVISSHSEPSALPIFSDLESSSDIAQTTDTLEEHPSVLDTETVESEEIDPQQADAIDESSNVDEPIETTLPATVEEPQIAISEPEPALEHSIVEPVATEEEVIDKIESGADPYIDTTEIESITDTPSSNVDTALDIYQTPIRNDDIFSDTPILNDAVLKNKLKTQAELRQAALRPLLFVLMLLLVLTLIGQLMYLFRTPLSIHLPGLKPFLVKACENLGCTVELPKNINLLAIDDSSLQEDEARTGLIHLKAVLINNADYPQTYPTIELTLTDDNDNPVLRRALAPKDYLKPEIDINAGIAGGSELSIKLPLMVEDTPLSGYKLFLTY